MDVSIIIVSYQSRDFIALCLERILSINDQLDKEIIIIDNASTDQSADYITKHFPNIRCHQNKSNVGFGKACNQGARMAQGDYILFLNPDCLIDDQAITQCINHYTIGKTGALGAMLFNSQLRPLPESGRRRPTLTNSIFRLLHLDQLTGQKLSYYQPIDHLSGLPIPTEVLTGAFFFIERSLFDKAGGFDERFFMYGEDIDLSIRLTDLGRNNYVIPQAYSIHFKGESTDKNKPTYYAHFFSAIRLYFDKHFTHVPSILRSLGTLLIQLVAAWRRWWSSWQSLIFFGLWQSIGVIFCSILWSHFYFGSIGYLSFLHVTIASIVIPAIWMIIYYIDGFHLSWSRSLPSFMPVWFKGAMSILLIYAFLPESVRFSRAVIALSITWGLLFFLINKRRNRQSVPSQYQLLSDHTGSTTWLSRQLHQEVTTVTGAPKLSQKTGLIADVNSSLFTTLFSMDKLGGSSSQILYFTSSKSQLYDGRSSRQKGYILDRFHHFRITDPRHWHQKILWQRFVVIVIKILTIYRSNAAMDCNLKRLWRAELLLVSYHNMGDNNPYLAPGLISPHYWYQSGKYTSEETDYRYAMHYSVRIDIYCTILGFFAILKRLRKEYGRKDQNISTKISSTDH